MATKTEQKNKGKQLTGKVVSTKMKDTIVVEVVSYAKHPKYQKYMKTGKRYHAHDAGNTAKEGDTVTIVECAPISKKKHFTLLTA